MRESDKGEREKRWLHEERVMNETCHTRDHNLYGT